MQEERQKIMDGIITQKDIKNLIVTVRGVQVLLDSDVAILYGYETKQINRTASRNKERFPESFRFQLTKEEIDTILSSRCQNGILKNANTIQFQTGTVYEAESLRCQNGTSSLADEEEQNLRSQNVTSSSGKYGGRRYLPYVFTEQGIAMLSGLLKSDIAVQVSIGIMQAFIEMRRIISFYGHTLERLTNVEYQLLEHDKRFDEVFDQIQLSQEFRQGVFYKGQIYDAFKLIRDIIHSADTSIIIIDNYADDSVLDMLTEKNSGVAVTIVSNKPSRISKLAINKFNAQYPALDLLKSEDFHDRFIIIDDKKLYHIGASLKDAGKKCFALSLIEDEEYLKKTKDRVHKE